MVIGVAWVLYIVLDVKSGCAQNFMLLLDDCRTMTDGWVWTIEKNDDIVVDPRKIANVFLYKLWSFRSPYGNL